MRKSGFLGKLRERLREPPATKEEVEQLGLNAKRETYKTQIVKAKQARPSKLANLVFGSPGQSQRSSSRMYRQPPREENSLLFSGNDSGFGKGLDDMIGAGSSPNSKKGKYTKSGIEDMFT